MVYIEYNEFNNKYLAAQKNYDKILSEKEELFIITQPKSIKYDKERIEGGQPSNAFDDYLIQKEKKKIDERLEEAKSILDDRERLLKLKELELRASKDWNDVIYIYYYIDKLSTHKIEKRVPFSQMQIWRKITHEIKPNLK